jgi:DNA-binding Lrp family transcriptional regulator
MMATQPQPDSSRSSTPAWTALDATDHELIRLLQSDPRAAYSALSKQVGLSDDAVRERLRRLRSERIIEIVASVDPGALGYTTLALVGVHLQGPAIPAARALADVPEFDLVFVPAGGFDLCVEVVARDEEQLVSLVDEHVRTIPGYASSTVFLYLEVLKWRPGGLGAPGGAQEPPQQTAELDDADRAIMAALYDDGRASFQDLARATGISYALVRRRTRALLSSGVVRVVTIMNRLVAGTALIAGVGICTTGEFHEVADAIAEIDEVEVALVTTGPFDVLLEVACRDKRHLTDLIGQRLSGLPGVVRTETWVYTHLFKLPVAWQAMT